MCCQWDFQRYECHTYVHRPAKNQQPQHAAMCSRAQSNLPLESQIRVRNDFNM